MYKKPNRKGSRLRKKSSVVMDRTMLKKFKEQHPEYASLTLPEFNAIVKQFNENIIEEVLKNRDGVSLPERLGEIVIWSFPKPKRKIPDFGKSNELGELRYHGNWDTDNKIGKIVYRNKGYRAIKTSRFWGFIPARRFKQQMSTAFKKFWQRYIYIDNRKASY